MATAGGSRSIGEEILMDSSEHIQRINPNSQLGVRQKIGFNNKEDRIVILPDELLSRILSYLPLKDAIRTSILSPRWKCLWTCIPNFDFEFHEKFPGRRRGVRFDQQKKFINIVNSLCRYHDVRFCIQNLVIRSFHENLGDHNHNFETWISFLSTRNIIKFSLALPSIPLCQLPSSLFTCETLEVLKLSGQFQLHLPTTPSLPCLKTLYFTYIKYSNGDTVERLLSGCPKLEVLYIYSQDAWISNISVLSLKRLSLCFYPSKEDFKAENSAIGTVISTPNLEYLILDDCESKYIVLNSMSSLVNADVNVGYLATSTKDVVGGHELVSAISDVKFLRLSCRAMNSLRQSYGHQPLPIFRNVVDLKLGLDRSRGWKFVLNLLQNVPNLQVLALFFDNNVHFGLYSTREDLITPGNVPVCLSLCLKKIEIHEYRGEVNELIFLAYLLEKAKVLENMNVHCCHELSMGRICSTHHDILQQLSYGSISCQLQYIHLTSDDFLRKL